MQILGRGVTCSFGGKVRVVTWTVPTISECTFGGVRYTHTVVQTLPTVRLPSSSFSAPPPALYPSPSSVPGHHHCPVRLHTCDASGDLVSAASRRDLSLETGFCPQHHAPRVPPPCGASGPSYAPRLDSVPRRMGRVCFIRSPVSRHGLLWPGRTWPCFQFFGAQTYPEKQCR